MKQTLTPEQSATLIACGISAESASEWEEADFKDVPIFNVGDLLSLLPKEIKQGSTEYELLIEGVETNWRVRYYYADSEGYDSTEAFNEEELIDALHNLLLWAIDHNHVKLD